MEIKNILEVVSRCPFLNLFFLVTPSKSNFKKKKIDYLYIFINKGYKRDVLENIDLFNFNNVTVSTLKTLPIYQLLLFYIITHSRELLVFFL